MWFEYTANYLSILLLTNVWVAFNLVLITNNAARNIPVYVFLALFACNILIGWLHTHIYVKKYIYIIYTNLEIKLFPEDFESPHCSISSAIFSFITF